MLRFPIVGVGSDRFSRPKSFKGEFFNPLRGLYLRLNQNLKKSLDGDPFGGREFPQSALEFRVGL